MDETKRGILILQLICILLYHFGVIILRIGLWAWLKFQDDHMLHSDVHRNYSLIPSASSYIGSKEDDMRIRDITVLFLALFIMLGGLAIPLWWSFAAPIISHLPDHLAELSRNITGLIDHVLGGIND